MQKTRTNSVFFAKIARCSAFRLILLSQPSVFFARDFLTIREICKQKIVQGIVLRMLQQRVEHLPDFERRMQPPVPIEPVVCPHIVNLHRGSPSNDIRFVTATLGLWMHGRLFRRAVKRSRLLITKISKAQLQSPCLYKLHLGRSSRLSRVSSDNLSTRESSGPHVIVPTHSHVSPLFAVRHFGPHADDRG